MSERLQHHGEQNEGLKDSGERQEAAKQAIEKKAEQAKHEHAENIDEIRSKIETEAKTKHEHDQPKHESSDRPAPMLINRELKDMAYQRTLRRVRNQLPIVSRNFSKVIHNPAVDAISEVGGKTVARPSGVLAGGITAVLGSSFFLWAARHYGYEYNFLLFALLFVAGFFLGLLIEAVLKLRRK